MEDQEYINIAKRAVFCKVSGDPLPDRVVALEYCEILDVITVLFDDMCVVSLHPELQFIRFN